MDLNKKYSRLCDKLDSLNETIRVINSSAAELIQFSAIMELKLKKKNISEKEINEYENRIDSLLKKHHSKSTI